MNVHDEVHMPTSTEISNALYMLQNFVDLPDRKARLFRVFPFSRLLQAFVTRQLTLVTPEMWDDPFENVVLRHELFQGLNVRLYGQCWTANSAETDALWRIYCPGKDGVRVATTVERLFFSLADTARQSAPVEYWIGKVQYLSESAIRSQLEDPAILQNFALGSGAKGLVQSLLLKREEFRHENEVRLIYCGHSEYWDITQRLKHFPIDPNALFDEVLFDPRMASDLVSAFTSVLRALGFDGLVQQSRLYHVPDLRLSLPSRV